MARGTSAARRYAEAAFELAEKAKSQDAWAKDLRLAAELLADERIRGVLDNPAVPTADRDSLVTKLLGKRVSGQVGNLVRLLAQRNRIELLPVVAAEFRRLLNRQNGVVEAIVTSALPLTPKELEALRQRLEGMTGATVELETAVDDSLIGGLTVRIGDRLLDASVRGRLERLRKQLSGRGGAGSVASVR
jgi:F-type H+-transporting ATPase subunit delta